MNELLKSIPVETWILQVFFIVFISGLLAWLSARILRRIFTSTSKTKTWWDDAIIAAAQPCIKAAIWLLGLTFAAHVIFLNTQSELFSTEQIVRQVGIVIIIAWFCLRLVNEARVHILEGIRQQEIDWDISTVDAFARLVRLAIQITIVLVVLQTIGISIAGVLAFGGIGGIAIGFAAKDLLANFFGGLMIYLDRPFSVGDWIRSPDRKIEGTVEDIGWRLTRIRTFDSRPLYIPNSIFTNIAVENPSRMSNRRIYETFGIRYDDIAVMEKITVNVKQMLENHEDIDTNQTLMVNFNSYAPSSLDFFVYTFSKTTNWVEFHKIKQDVLLKIAAIIESHGAEIAFPTQQLKVDMKQ